MTTDRDGNRSNPYHLNPEKACEACIFGSGEHAAWCLKRWPGIVPVEIPSDCEFCSPDQCGDFAAVGYLGYGGPAICLRCLEDAKALSRLSPASSTGDIQA